MKLSAYLLLVFVIFLSACGSNKKGALSSNYQAQKPLWVESLGITRYGTNQYFAALTHTQIHSTVEEQLPKIEEATKTKLLEKIISGENEAQVSYELSVFEEEFPFIETKHYYDSIESRLYVLAVIHKNTLKNYLTKKLGETDLLIRDSIFRAEKYKKEENYSQSFVLYLQSLSLLDYYTRKRNLFHKLTNDRAFDELSSRYIEADLQDMILNVRIDIVSGNNQKATSESFLAEPIKLLVYFSHNGVKIPLQDFPIKTELVTANATIETKPRTDGEGVVELSVTKVFTTEHEDNIIEVGLDFEKFIHDTKKLIPVKTNVIYTISPLEEKGEHYGLN